MGGSWTEQNNNFPIEATDVIKIYNLNKGTFVITAMTSDFMGGLVYLVDLDVPGTNSPAQTVTLPDDSSSPFEIRADGIFNFVVIG